MSKYPDIGLVLLSCAYYVLGLLVYVFGLAYAVARRHVCRRPASVAMVGLALGALAQLASFALSTAGWWLTAQSDGAMRDLVVSGRLGLLAFPILALSALGTLLLVAAAFMDRVPAAPPAPAQDAADVAP